MIKRGFYKHYKGGLYVVLCNGKHSETTEEMVGYYSLYYRDWWFRPAKIWNKDVEVENKTEVITMQRFQRITLWQAAKDYLSYLFG